MNKSSDDHRINKFWKLYKKDLMLVAAVLAAAVISALVYQSRNGSADRENTGGVLEITIDGEIYGTYPLDQEQEINVVSSYGRNTVVIEQNRAYVTEADCPDKVCEGMQKIIHDGDMICCLPHRLFLTVRGGGSAEYDAVAY